MASQDQHSTALTKAQSISNIDRKHALLVSQLRQRLKKEKEKTTRLEKSMRELTMHLSEEEKDGEMYRAQIKVLQDAVKVQAKVLRGKVPLEGKTKLSALMTAHAAAETIIDLQDRLARLAQENMELVVEQDRAAAQHRAEMTKWLQREWDARDLVEQKHEATSECSLEMKNSKSNATISPEDTKASEAALCILREEHVELKERCRQQEAELAEWRAARAAGNLAERDTVNDNEEKERMILEAELHDVDMNIKVVEALKDREKSLDELARTREVLVQLRADYDALLTTTDASESKVATLAMDLVAAREKCLRLEKSILQWEDKCSSLLNELASAPQGGELSSLKQKLSVMEMKLRQTKEQSNRRDEKLVTIRAKYKALKEHITRKVARDDKALMKLRIRHRRELGSLESVVMGLTEKVLAANASSSFVTSQKQQQNMQCEEKTPDSVSQDRDCLDHADFDQSSASGEDDETLSTSMDFSEVTDAESSTTTFENETGARFARLHALISSTEKIMQQNLTR